ncbi:MAG: ABC transporter permease, partial [Gemmatimonadaceae bacterium]
MNFSELRRRTWYLLNRNQASHDLEEEMRLHVDLRAESLRSVDVGDELAYASAQRRFGNTTELQQRSRDFWGFGRFDDFTHDIRFAFRRLKQQRGFALAVIGVMAIGIGATTAMFSAVDAVLLRPLPFPNADQLVVLPTVHVPLKSSADFEEPSRGRQLFGDVQRMHDLFSHVAAYGTGGLNISDDAHPLRANTGVVTADFFNTLGISPFKGRAFLPAEGVPDAPNVVLLSYGLWQSQYGGRDIDKLRITLNKRSYQVVGVMPQGFNFPEQSDLWVPMTVPNTMQTFEAFQLSIRQT